MPLVGQGHSPTHQQVGCLKTPRATSGHGPVHQRAQNLVPDTRLLALDLGPPEPCSQRPWDLAVPTSGLAPAPGQLKPHSLLWQEPAHPLAGRHQPWTHSPAPTPPTSRPPPALRHLGLLSQLPQDPDPLTSRPAQTSGHPGPIASCVRKQPHPPVGRHCPQDHQIPTASLVRTQATHK